MRSEELIPLAGTAAMFGASAIAYLVRLTFTRRRNDPQRAIELLRDRVFAV
jgi:hypothetical protein